MLRQCCDCEMAFVLTLVATLSVGGVLTIAIL